MYKYIGNGFIDRVPARDLTEEEARKYGVKQLVESGLYIKVKTIAEKQSEVKDGH